MDPFQEIWKNSLLGLPDRNFFDLVRNYLGKAETPYNKQKMIKGLEQFLAKPEVQERIASLVTPPEAAILSVVHFRQGAGMEELVSAFRDRYRPREFEALLRNLRERLLIFTVREGSELKYMITPSLKGILGERVLHPLNIVSSHPVSGPAEERMYWLTDPFFMAFCSFCLHTEVELLPERTLRKRDMNRFKELFAGHLFFRDDKEILDLCLNAALGSGVLRFEGGRFVPHLPAMKALADLTPVSRFYYLAACAASGLSGLQPADIYRMVRALHEGLPADREFPPESLIRILPLLSGSVPPVRHSVLTYLIDNFAALGILLPGSGEGTFRRNTSPVEFPAHSGLLTVMGNMEISVRPEISFYPEISLFLSLDQYDLYSRYSLNRDAVIRGLESGMDIRQFRELLAGASGHGIPPAVELSLTEWERERNSLRLYRGILLVVDSERLPVLEGTGMLAPYTKLNPAPGIYLLDEMEREAWSRVLDQAGFRIPERISDFRQDLPVPLALPEIAVQGWNDQGSNGERVPLPVYDRTRLEETLQVKGLKPDQQEVLRERLDRKILFLPSQVTLESLRQEPMTARGIDYQGKINLVEAAITAADIIEVELADSDYNVHTEQFYPLKLEKEEGEWVVRGETRPAEEPFESKVSKLASVKRVRVALI